MAFKRRFNNDERLYAGKVKILYSIKKKKCKLNHFMLSWTTLENNAVEQKGSETATTFSWKNTFKNTS